MRFITSIFLLSTATSGVVSAYFIGHGIVAGGTWPWVTAGVLLVAAVLFGVVYLRLAKGEVTGRGSEH